MKISLTVEFDMSDDMQATTYDAITAILTGATLPHDPPAKKTTKKVVKKAPTSSAPTSKTPSEAFKDVEPQPEADAPSTFYHVLPSTDQLVIIKEELQKVIVAAVGADNPKMAANSKVIKEELERLGVVQISMLAADKFGPLLTFVKANVQ
jgi:hypothetical protein